VKNLMNNKQDKLNGGNWVVEKPGHQIEELE
jgi:hypothetical protein